MSASIASTTQVWRLRCAKSLPSTGTCSKTLGSPSTHSWQPTAGASGNLTMQSQGCPSTGLMWTHTTEDHAVQTPSLTSQFLCFASRYWQPNQAFSCQSCLIVISRPVQDQLSSADACRGQTRLSENHELSTPQLEKCLLPCESLSDAPASV